MLFLNPAKLPIQWAAIELAKEKGATIFGICNVVGASIPRTTHAGVIPTPGQKLRVASTKAFNRAGDRVNPNWHFI